MSESVFHQIREEIQKTYDHIELLRNELERALQIEAYKAPVSLEQAVENVLKEWELSKRDNLGLTLAFSELKRALEKHLELKGLQFDCDA